MPKKRAEEFVQMFELINYPEMFYRDMLSASRKNNEKNCSIY